MRCFGRYRQMYWKVFLFKHFLEPLLHALHMAPFAIPFAPFAVKGFAFVT